jgi:hypothetical protein
MEEFCETSARMCWLEIFGRRLGIRLEMTIRMYMLQNSNGTKVSLKLHACRDACFHVDCASTVTVYD